MGHESKSIIGHQANAAGNEVEGPHAAGAAFEAVSVVLGTLLAGRQSALMAGGKSIPALAVLSCASLSLHSDCVVGALRNDAIRHQANANALQQQLYRQQGRF